MSTTTTTRERPILFSGPMVKAILDGRKTMTRRAINLDRLPVLRSELDHILGVDGCRMKYKHRVRLDKATNEYIYEDSTTEMRSPYGSPEELLWVRETWALVQADEDGIDDWVDRGPIPDSLPWPGWAVWHRAGHPYAYDHPDDRGFRWRPSIHMPRWASRLTLRITEVRVERLQDITEADAIAEGIDVQMGDGTGPGSGLKWTGPGYWDGFSRNAYGKTYHVPGHDGTCCCIAGQRDRLSAPVCAFRGLWDGINAGRLGCDWKSNPWLWCIRFERVEANA